MRLASWPADQHVPEASASWIACRSSPGLRHRLHRRDHRGTCAVGWVRVAGELSKRRAGPLQPSCSARRRGGCRWRRRPRDARHRGQLGGVGVDLVPQAEQRWVRRGNDGRHAAPPRRTPRAGRRAPGGRQRIRAGPGRRETRGAAQERRAQHQQEGDDGGGDGDGPAHHDRGHAMPEALLGRGHRAPPQREGVHPVSQQEEDGRQDHDREQPRQEATATPA